MGKHPSFKKLQIEEGIGIEDEDVKRLPYLTKPGMGSCRAMPRKAGVKRLCGKDSRIRWNNQKINLFDSNFSPEEEELIIKLHATIGSRWTIIAQQLPGRTDNEVKNFWNKRLKKKLTAIGIDPITHRPFSQILADYGNIGGFPKARNHFGLRRDIGNDFLQKSEPPDSSSDFKGHCSARIPSSETKPFQDHFLSNRPLHLSRNSFDLLSQLQAITMVTDSSKCSNPGTSARILTECMSSSASSSPPESPPSATNKAVASSSFSWCDFLLEDEFLPIKGQEQENWANFSPKDENKREGQTEAAAENQNHSSIKALEDSSASFVEAMLERDDEMLPDFHGLLEGHFY